MRQKMIDVFSKIGSKFAASFSWIPKISSKAFHSYKSKTLLKKILYTILLITIFRIAATITTPFVKINESLASDSSTFLGMLNLIGGGALSNFSIVALGISPYITASIIMTLIQSEAFPAVHRLANSGPAGKRKINVITRIITLFFAIIQAMTIIQQFRITQFVELLPPVNNSLWYQWVVIPVVLLGGSLFTLFLGEQITSKGVGNGTSLIIFSGIAAGLPGKLHQAFIYFVSQGSNGTLIGAVNFIIYLAIFIFLVYLIAFFYKAERHVPTQQTGSGLTSDQHQMSHLPIKLNPAGVMPIIFAMTILLLPLTISEFLHHHNEARIWMQKFLPLTAPLGLSIFIGVAFVFSILMGLITFNPYTVSDNFKKNGTFIPGIRPGQETEKYLTAIIVRLGIFSGIYLSLLSSIEYIAQIIGLSKSITLGGTSLIILVTVGIETIEHLKARDTTQNITRARMRAIEGVSEGDSTKGLLW